MTTRDEIQRYFEAGASQGRSHLLMVCDTYDHDDYPVYTDTEEQARRYVESPGPLQRVMEVYNLSKDMASQLGKLRCFEY